MEFGFRSKIKRRKYKSYRGEVGKVAPNIIQRNFVATKPNQKWTTDVTQFNCPFGKAYLSPILDMFNGEIIAYNLSEHPNFDQVADMLHKAFFVHRNLTGLVLHSDQGWQYQNERWIELLKKHNVTQSMSRKGNCIDNCIMESFFGVLKNEMFYDFEHTFKNFEDLKLAIDQYIHYYNYHRLKKRINYMSPVQYRRKICAEISLN